MHGLPHMAEDARDRVVDSWCELAGVEYSRNSDDVEKISMEDFRTLIKRPLGS